MVLEYILEIGQSYLVIGSPFWRIFFIQSGFGKEYALGASG